MDEKVDNSGWRIKIVADGGYTHQIVGQKWVPGGALLSRGRVWPVDVPETSCKSRPAGLSSDLYPPRSIEGKSRTKLCQKRPQVPGLGHLQSYARFKGGKTKQGYQRMVGWCRLMVMADGDG